MLFAWGSFRRVKNCDGGLENAARVCRPREAFSSRDATFSKRDTLHVIYLCYLLSF